MAYPVAAADILVFGAALQGGTVTRLFAGAVVTRKFSTNPALSGVGFI